MPDYRRRLHHKGVYTLVNTRCNGPVATDPLAVIERGYRLGGSDAEWLRDVGAAVYEQIGAGCGLLGFQYRVTPEGRLEGGTDVTFDLPDGFGEMMRAGLPHMPPEFVRSTFVRCEA